MHSLPESRTASPDRVFNAAEALTNMRSESLDHPASNPNSETDSINSPECSSPGTIVESDNNDPPKTKRELWLKKFAELNPSTYPKETTSQYPMNAKLRSSPNAPSPRSSVEPMIIQGCLTWAGTITVGNRMYDQYLSPVENHPALLHGSPPPVLSQKPISHSRALSGSRSPASSSSSGSPRRTRRAFTKEDNNKLIMLRSNNVRWKDIAKEFPGRTRASLQVHYYARLSEKAKKAEDAEGPDMSDIEEATQ